MQGRKRTPGMSEMGGKGSLPFDLMRTKLESTERIRMAWRIAVFVLGAAMAGASGNVLLTWLSLGGLADIWREYNLISVVFQGLVLVGGLWLLIWAIIPAKGSRRTVR
jgi:hypothetical protein